MVFFFEKSVAIAVYPVKSTKYFTGGCSFLPCKGGLRWVLNKKSCKYYYTNMEF